MKTAISIPDDVFRRAERYAKRLGVSRSELYVRALREFLNAEHDADVTASYSRAFGSSDEQPELEFHRSAARRLLSEVEW